MIEWLTQYAASIQLANHARKLAGQLKSLERPQMRHSLNAWFAAVESVVWSNVGAQLSCSTTIEGLKQWAQP